MAYRQIGQFNLDMTIRREPSSAWVREVVRFLLPSSSIHTRRASRASVQII